MSADLLARIVERLDRAGIAHMVAGSFASTFHGEPRTTADMDLVIDPNQASLDRFVGSLDPNDFYVDIDTAREALTDRTQFNVVDMATGWKVDLIIRKDRPFSDEEFARRLPVELAGVRVFVASAEDTILSKLEWSVLSGGSERQLRDVLGILRMRREALDQEYLQKWARLLGVDELLRRVLAGSYD